jgi:hypothetical protein
MVTAQELVVAIRSEGVKEVNDDLKKTDERMQETADSAGNSADRLSGFAKSIKGAMAAIVAGLAIGVAGVLTQVPVLGEATAGLKAIFESLGFQIDDKLRPFVSKLNTEFFDLASAISEGDYEQVRKEIKDIAGVFGDLDPAAVIDEVTTAFNKLTEGVNFSKIGSDLIGGFVSAFEGIADDIDFQQVVNDFTTFRNNLLNKIIDTISNFADEITVKDIEETTSTLIETILTSAKRRATEVDWFQLLIAIIKLIGKINIGVAKAVKDELVDPLLDTIVSKFNEGVGQAKQLGKDLLSKIADGIREDAAVIGDAIAGITIPGTDLSFGDIASFPGVSVGDESSDDGDSADTGRPDQRAMPAGPIATSQMNGLSDAIETATGDTGGTETTISEQTDTTPTASIARSQINKLSDSIQTATGVDLSIDEGRDEQTDNTRAVSIVRSQMNELSDSIQTATGVDLSIDDVSAFRDVPTDDTDGSDTGRPEQTGNTPAGAIATTNQIDGQTLSESTGRFRRGPTARNGGL